MQTENSKCPGESHGASQANPDVTIDPKQIRIIPSLTPAEAQPQPLAPFAAPVASTPPVGTNSASPIAHNSGHNLLNALWRSPDRIHQIGTLDRLTGKFKNKHVGSVSAALVMATDLSNSGIETYFACAEYLTPNSRISVNASGAWAFWMDIDCGDNKAADGKGYSNETDAIVALNQFCTDAELSMPTHVVSSGSGLHVYWALDGVVLREPWLASAAKLKALTKTLQFLADDSRTSDIASVLRIPGTLNFKYDPPRPVTPLAASRNFIAQAAMLGAIDSAHNRLCRVTGTQPDLDSANIPSSALTQSANECGGSKLRDQDSAGLRAMLDFLDPDMGRNDWLHCGMAIFNTMGGGDEGLDLFDAWSSMGKKYEGRRAIETQWRSFKPDLERQVTLATIKKLVADAGGNWIEICDAAEPQFERCDFDVVRPGKQSADKRVECRKPLDKPSLGVIVDPRTHTTSIAAAINNPLDRYSLRGKSDELEMSVVDAVPLLDELALMGQATVFYAAPNTGKTLITLSLLNDAIKNGRVDPSKVYYLNMDDSSKGLLAKVRIAEEYGFHMVAEGHRDFNASAFLSIVRDMIENDQARNVVIILDTLKKFVDLMDKGRTSSFTNVIRPFVLKGGTLIALAHTNKKPDKNGKPVYGGVSDIMNDIDCAYTIAEISDENGEKVVEFVNTKHRGSVVQRAAYSYCTGSKIAYDEILLSVQPLGLNTLEPLKQAEAIKSDAEVISAITDCINDGSVTKMKLADAAAKRANISKRAAMQIIDKYTGSDPAIHRWSFSVRERGAKVFALLDAAPPELDNTKI